MFVTTYVSTISTNLGGQAVTTSRCDVYLNNNAVPGGYEALGNGDHYLTECVDPRRSTCSAGENQAATGTGGCNGSYPPTGALASTYTTTGSTNSPTKTNGAGSWRRSWTSSWCLLASVWIVLALSV